MDELRKQVGETIYDNDHRFFRIIFNGCSALMVGAGLFCFAGAFFVDGYIDLKILRFLVIALIMVFIGNRFIRDDHQFCQHGIIKMKKGKPMSHHLYNEYPKIECGCYFWPHRRRTTNYYFICFFKNKKDKVLLIVDDFHDLKKIWTQITTHHPELNDQLTLKRKTYEAQKMYEHLTQSNLN